MQTYDLLLVSDIIDRAKAEAIGSTQSQLTALQDTQLIEKVEQINSDFVKAGEIKGGWSHMLEIENFNTVTNTTLNGAVSSGDATFILTSASDFDASGKVVFETSNNALDFVDYESKATNTLTVSTTAGDQVISLDHADGTRVEKLYPVASNYNKTQKLYVGSAEYFYQNANLFPQAQRFTVIDGYYMFPKGIGAEDVTHYYYKRPATLTALTDTSDIPTVFQRYAIEMLKAHIFMIRRKRADVPTALQLADIALENAINHDKNHTVPSASYGGISTDY